MLNIHFSENWIKSRCLEQEELINSLIFNKIENLGFSRTDHRRIWKKDHQTLIVCLVDDVISCGTDYETDFPYLFDKNTNIITDNYFTCPTLFKVSRIPISFFGIYNYAPDLRIWDPKKDFALQVNRIDLRRTQLITDLAWRTHLDNGYVNFNCDGRPFSDDKDPQGFFQKFWQDFGPNEQKYMESTYSRLIPLMPLRNYSIDFDMVPYGAWVNIIVETYGSDNTISLSEKIFRALVTPAPWTVYSGRYTVAYLESIGFDCMSDMIDHNHYDCLKEIEKKLQIFNWKTLEIVSDLKNQGIESTRKRCIQAASHNRNLLDKMQQEWPDEFSKWLDTLPNQLV